MIYIDNNSEVPLDNEFHRIHNICAIIYDQLTEILTEDNYQIMSHTPIKIDEKTHVQIEEFRNESTHALDWLKLNGLNEEINQVVSKHITMSILSDFVNFIYESLSCAMRGKMTVAYALLRKPLTDELLLFEQLLDDSEEFIERFFHEGDPTGYDPSSSKIDKKEIIKSALFKAQPNMVFNSDLIYSLRYGKELGKGINAFSNHALHIVTNNKNYRTSEQNLNFVFSNKEDVYNYWNSYYFMVPYLLIYSASVIDNLIFDFLSDQSNLHLKNLKALVRAIGLLLWNEFANESSSDEIFQIFTKELKLNCENCNCSIQLERADFELFFETRAVLCPECFENNINSSDFKRKLNDLLILISQSKN